MTKYRLNNEVKNDLIRIHHYGVKKFGMTQADKYFESFFKYFEIIAQGPFSFESVDYIKKDYRRCVCGVDSIYFKVNKDIVEIMAIVGRQEGYRASTSGGADGPGAVRGLAPADCT